MNLPPFKKLFHYTLAKLQPKNHKVISGEKYIGKFKEYYHEVAMVTSCSCGIELDVIIIPWTKRFKRKQLKPD